MPTRKNFPSRKTARRKAALDRLKAAHGHKISVPQHAADTMAALQRKINGGK